MGWELDSKNRAILYHLSLDSRQPISRLSKKVKLNREVVRYRIGRMVKDGIITKFLTVVAIPRLGYLPSMFFMRFQNTGASDEKEIVDYLKGEKSVVYLASTNGRFDLAVATVGKNLREIADFCDRFRERYGRFISDFDMSNIIMAYGFPREYLLDREPRGLAKLDACDKVHEYDATLDYVDLKILSALGKDARMKAVEIARRAGVSADAVADRIGKLKKNGVITRFTVLIDGGAINRRHFRSFVSFHHITKVEKKFLEYCQDQPNAVQVKRMLGPWEYEVDLELENETELREIHSKFKERFKDSVRSTSFVHVYKIHKYDMGGFLVP